MKKIILNEDNTIDREYESGYLVDVMPNDDVMIKIGHYAFEILGKKEVDKIFEKELITEFDKEDEQSFFELGNHIYFENTEQDQEILGDRQSFRIKTTFKFYWKGLELVGETLSEKIRYSDIKRYYNKTVLYEELKEEYEKKAEKKYDEELSFLVEEIIASVERLELKNQRIGNFLIEDGECLYIDDYKNAEIELRYFKNDVCYSGTFYDLEVFFEEFKEEFLNFIKFKNKLLSE